MDFIKDGVDIRGAISSLKDGKLGEWDVLFRFKNSFFYFKYSLI